MSLFVVDDIEDGVINLANVGEVRGREIEEVEVDEVDGEVRIAMLNLDVLDVE